MSSEFYIDKDWSDYVYNELMSIADSVYIHNCGLVNSKLYNLLTESIGQLKFDALYERFINCSYDYALHNIGVYSGIILGHFEILYFFDLLNFGLLNQVINLTMRDAFGVIVTNKTKKM